MEIWGGDGVIWGEEGTDGCGWACIAAWYASHAGVYSVSVIREGDVSLC